MSTPEQPDTPALTRKQMREIRNTGATPIVTGDVPATEPTSVDISAGEATAPPAENADLAPVAPAPASAPLPRAAVPPAIGDAPVADASVDLGVTPLTRRQARQQERIRTASVPVITPDVAAAYATAGVGTDETPAESIDSAPATEDDGSVSLLTQVETVGDEPTIIDAVPEASSGGVLLSPDTAPDTLVEDERAVLNPQFGAELLAGEPIEVALPASFDQLISRSVTGSITTGNALILSQTPSAPPLSAPVTATGEVLITGTFNLPEGLGSTGHAHGTADGKEADAVLVDGELPAHSSPTPIAASAAISTVKTTGDVITPPTPEKGGRLMMTLAITAGVLALALVGVLILAFVTGVF
jgi:hypothetical protein